MSRAILRAWATTAIAVAACAVVGCSLLNQEGPTSTCEQLMCGKINACEDGIIAQCVDGQNMQYHACELADACEQSWQIKGAYRCAVEDTDCEGCRPERSGCVDGSSSSTEGTSASSAASSTTDAASSAEASSSSDASSSDASSSSASGSSASSGSGSSGSGL